MYKKTLSLLLSIAVFSFLIFIGGCSNDMQKQSIPVSKAAKFPEKPLTMIVPFSVGGGLDLTARSLEKFAPKYLGQPLVIINKPGGGGSLGWNELAGSASDGYTLGITAPELLLLPLYGSLKYNYPTALDPLAQIIALPMALAVRSDQEWQTLDDVITFAKDHPGQLKFGNGGMGSLTHLTGEMFCQAADISIEQVPFAGAGEVTASLLGGHVQLAFVNPTIIKEHIKKGTIRVLATTGEQRMADPEFSQLPTLKEKNLNVAITNWHGVAIPKDTPPEIKNKLAEGLKGIITDPEFTKNMTNLGLQIEYLGPQQSQDKWLADNQRLTKTIQGSGILEKIKAQKK